MPTDPVAAGRKGGSQNTPAQQAARKRNGFQPRDGAQPGPVVTAAQEGGPTVTEAKVPLFIKAQE